MLAKWINNDFDGKRRNLRNADLSNANLIGADLSNADLSNANLRNADLSNADLIGANLIGANLRNANLRYANLIGAVLIGADLIGADFTYPIACPEKGTFVGFKKANGFIVESEITENALRSSGTTRKCRCSEARVLSITNLDGTSCNITSIASTRDSNFIYTVGETKKVDNFDTNRWTECAPGIHFFITREEAVRY